MTNGGRNSVKPLTPGRRRMGLSALFLALICTSNGAPAAIQDLEQIRTAVRAFVRQQVADSEPRARVEVGALDPRLRVAACRQPLQTFLPAGSQLPGNATVGVRCNGRAPWLLYVPVSVRVFERVLVASHPLQRGQAVKRADFRLERRDLTLLNGGYITDPERALGKVVRRPIGLGAALTPAALEARRLVRRGERVAIVATGRTMEVRMRGKALADGAAGEKVRVRNLSSKRVIEGVVVASGVVRVEM